MLVTEAINKGEASPGLAGGAPTVKCFSSKDSQYRCGEVAIRYTVKKATGIDLDEALVKPTRQIWKALFQDPSVEGGRIKVEGPTTSPGGIKSTSSLFTLSCTRTDGQRIKWGNVDASGLKTFCKYQAYSE